MKTHAIGLLAILLAAATAAPLQAAENGTHSYSRSSGAGSNNGGGQDWPQPRPQRPRGPSHGGGGFGPVIIFVPPAFDAPYEREVAPPPGYERPAKRAEKPIVKKKKKTVAKTVKPAKVKPRKPVAPQRVAAAPAQPIGPHVPAEVLFSIGTPGTLEAVLARYRLTQIETAVLSLTGTTLVRARLAKDSDLPRVLRQLKADQRVALAQPNHLYALQADEADLASVQYAPEKIHASEAHQHAEGKLVLVAVIDSGIDGEHPELQGTLDPKSAARTAGPHGTAIAGVIAAHKRLASISPGARILAYDAFIGADGAAAQGSTLDILKSLDRAAADGARIVNMSFSGPKDDLLTQTLAAANDRGMVLVAAAGNQGPKAAPVFPAADPSVIAVTATDPADKIYASANRGAYVALAAPGVDILSAAPGGLYQQLSGTSLAAAHVTGVAALLLDEDPELKPDEIRAILTGTAKDIGKPGRDNTFGAGLVDAAAAVAAVPKRTAGAETAKPVLQPASLK